MRGDVTPAWTLIIVPPKLTLSPKRVGVKMRWLRMFAMLMVAVVSASWMSVTTDARIALRRRPSAQARSSTHIQIAGQLK